MECRINVSGLNGKFFGVTSQKLTKDKVLPTVR